ncbi:MAG: hypothetical protein ABI600_07730 [Luteolibacter sp.]
MRRLDHRKPGKHRFGLGDSPADAESQNGTSPVSSRASATRVSCS